MLGRCRLWNVGHGGFAHFSDDIMVRDIDALCFCCMYEVANLRYLRRCESLVLDSGNMVWLGGVPVSLFEFHDTQVVIGMACDCVFDGVGADCLL